jgi:hypothetical protein
MALPGPHSAPYVSAIAFAVPLLFVVALGLPAYLLLHRRRRDGARSLLVVGAITGALPMAWVFPLWSVAGSAYWRHDGDGLFDGLPSLSGWAYWLTDLSMCVFVGVLAASAFWWVVRRDARGVSTTAA